MAKEVLVELGILGDTLLIGVAKGEGRKAGLEVLHFLDRWGVYPTVRGWHGDDARR